MIKKLFTIAVTACSFTVPQAQKTKTATESQSKTTAFLDVKKAISEREKSLLADGWTKVYENYKTESVAVEVNFKQGFAYTALGALKAKENQGQNAMLIIKDGNNTYAGTQGKVSDNYAILETDDFQPSPGVTKANVGVGLNEGVVADAGLVIFEKTIDFKRDFYRLLDARSIGFKNFRGTVNGKNDAGFTTYNGTIGLGYFKNKINETAEAYEYVLEMDMTNPETMTFLNNLIPVLQELPAKGYTPSEYKNRVGNDVTKFTKDGEDAMMLISNLNTNTIYFEIAKKK
jgi:hypothetical protein